MYLKQEIQRARKFNTELSFVCILFVCFLVWFYKYSDYELPLLINAIFIFVPMIIWFLFSELVNELSCAKCPKCKHVVEKGRLLFDELPEACPRCNLPYR